jgi:3-oxoacyl-[acyl-carrier protein] reductase
MPADLHGKAGVVTGASKGIGLAIARGLARAGAGVVISARKEAEVRQAAEALSAETGARVVGVRCDVRDHTQVREMIAAAERELGGLDVLVNNAGVGGFAAVDEMAPEQWNQIIETNLSGVFHCCHEAIPLLRKRGEGWIINIASLAGKNAFAGGAAYNASKFGLVGFSEALMMDVRHEGIRVSYVMPGSVNTHFGDKEPSDRNDWMIQPEDVAQVVMDLLAFPGRTLPSRVEVRPSRPPKK